MDRVPRHTSTTDQWSAPRSPGPFGWSIPLVWVVSLTGIVAIGLFDYASGTELRVYPLYYGPIALVAWNVRRSGGLLAATLCAGSWLLSNSLAGLPYSSRAMMAANTFVNGASFVFVGWMISTLRGALTETHRLSRTDALTQLRNARAFTQDAAPLLALHRRARRPITMAYLDLDHFKSVNDTFGHQAGDTLLRQIGQALRQSVRPSDICARLGGDEFVVLLLEVGPRDLDAALHRIGTALREATAAVPTVTVSVGAITFAVPPSNVDELIAQADALMYEAKAAGRDRISRLFVPAPPAAPS